LERYQSPKLAAGKHVFYLKKALKIEQKWKKKRKIANILEIARNDAKSSKLLANALLSGVLEGIIIGLIYIEKMSQIERYLRW